MVGRTRARRGVRAAEGGGSPRTHSGTQIGRCPLARQDGNSTESHKVRLGSRRVGEKQHVGIRDLAGMDLTVFARHRALVAKK